MVGEVLALTGELGNPPEAEIAPRSRYPPFVDELPQSASDLENASRSTRIVIRALHSLLHVTCQHYILSDTRLSPTNESFDHHLPWLFSLTRLESGVNARANVDRSRRLGEPIVQLDTLPQRENECEGRLLPIDLRRGNGEPPDLVRHVEAGSISAGPLVKGTWIPGNAGRALSDNDITHDCRDGSVREHDLSGDILSLELCCSSRAYVDQLSGYVGGAAEVGEVKWCLHSAGDALRFIADYPQLCRSRI